jgi:N-acetyl-D-muramate 6-phosphate phosphatase
MAEAVFFDLDGTLADTAPDLAGALNRLLTEQGREAMAYHLLRPHVSAGARGLLRAGFGIAPDAPDYPALHKRFLDLYEGSLCAETTLFAGMAEVLDALDARAIRWGVVTNKPQRFTLPLMQALGLAGRVAAIVSGDTTARAKPDPMPLLHACDLAGVSPATSVYVGDDLRDVEAGRAAGMRTFAAAWGYLGDGLPIGEWGADRLLHTPEAMLADL